jgi:hypothetical protein
MGRAKLEQIPLSLGPRGTQLPYSYQLDAVKPAASLRERVEQRIEAVEAGHKNAISGALTMLEPYAHVLPGAAYDSLLGRLGRSAMWAVLVDGAGVPTTERLLRGLRALGVGEPFSEEEWGRLTARPLAILADQLAAGEHDTMQDALREAHLKTGAGIAARRLASHGSSKLIESWVDGVTDVQIPQLLKEVYGAVSRAPWPSQMDVRAGFDGRYRQLGLRKPLPVLMRMPCDRGTFLTHQFLPTMFARWWHVALHELAERNPSSPLVVASLELQRQIRIHRI